MTLVERVQVRVYRWHGLLLARFDQDDGGDALLSFGVTTERLVATCAEQRSTISMPATYLASSAAISYYMALDDGECICSRTNDVNVLDPFRIHRCLYGCADSGETNTRNLFESIFH